MKNKKKIKILITGASGFVGQNLVKKILKEKKFEIYATQNKSNLKSTRKLSILRQTY